MPQFKNVLVGKVCSVAQQVDSIKSDLSTGFSQKPVAILIGR